MLRRNADLTLGLMVWAAALLVGGCQGVSRAPARPAAPAAPARVMPDPADVQEAVENNAAFALDLYAKLAAERKDANLFFSPYSVSSALAMTYAGARGNTAAQMKKALHFGLDDGKLHAAFASLTDALNAGEPGKKRGYELAVANALWGQKGYRFLDPFISLNKVYYDAGLNQVDFARDTEGARQTINAWVEKQTREKIKELIKPGILNDLTRLVLTNAVYFKGDWASPFQKNLTRDMTFTVAKGKAIDVPMMIQTGWFPLLRGDSFQGLELPYAGEKLAMDLFLPEKADGLGGLEKRIAAGNLDKWLLALGKAPKEKVIVLLPRFKITAAFELNGALKSLGMADAFDLSLADLSGMDGRKPPDPAALFIAAVLHKAFVDVNEEGTEAAAATAIEVKAGNGHQPPVFNADHPFVFLIRDRESGSILFLGRVANPKD